MAGRALTPEHYTAGEIVRLLQLEPLEQEGGFFRRTAESTGIDPVSGRREWSVIYSLITPEGFSALHRLAADEIWCFHAGDTLESLRLPLHGPGGWVKLGLNPAAGERLQDVVPARVWQGTRLVPGGRWALVSCMVTPGFRWEDFELGTGAELQMAHPEFVNEIQTLIRPQPAA